MHMTSDSFVESSVVGCIHVVSLVFSFYFILLFFLVGGGGGGGWKGLHTSQIYVFVSST